MALSSLPALQVASPENHAMEAFMAGQERVQAMQARKQQMDQSALDAKRRGMEGFYVLSAGVLRDGVVKPDEWEDALDVMEQGGADPAFIQRLRGKPQMAEILARSSTEALKVAHDERMMDLEYEKLANELQKSSDEDARKQQIDAILRKHAPDIADAYKWGMLDGPKAYAELQKRLNPGTDREPPPSGYRYTDTGDLQAIPGGPQDPENPLNNKKVADQPLTSAETKELFNAQDAVTAGETAVPMIEQMIALNKTAWDGPLAEAGTAVGSMFGDKNSVDTQDLKNLVTGQALEQLKAVFGAMPTEGERKILLEIQGSVGQPREVRQRIYDRALSMAKRRIEINKAKAEGIRTGDYKEPGYDPSIGSSGLDLSGLSDEELLRQLSAE